MTGNIQQLIDKAKLSSNFLKAIAHEYRLLILCHLTGGEKSVQELEKVLSTSQSNISQHLAKLRDRDIVEFRKEGNQVFYRLKDERVRQLIECLQVSFCS